MPDFTIEIMQQCTNNTGNKIINGHSCTVYSNGYSECDCDDFQFRRKAKHEDCKHLKELKNSLCFWHEMWGKAQTEQQKKEHICPACGSKTISVRVAV